MKLMKARRWAEREFAEGSEPDIKTIRLNCDVRAR